MLPVRPRAGAKRREDSSGSTRPLSPLLPRQRLRPWTRRQEERFSQHHQPGGLRRTVGASPRRPEPALPGGAKPGPLPRPAPVAISRTPRSPVPSHRGSLARGSWDRTLFCARDCSSGQRCMQPLASCHLVCRRPRTPQEPHLVPAPSCKRVRRCGTGLGSARGRGWTAWAPVGRMGVCAGSRSARECGEQGDEGSGVRYERRTGEYEATERKAIGSARQSGGRGALA